MRYLLFFFSFFFLACQGDNSEQLLLSSQLNGFENQRNVLSSQVSGLQSQLSTVQVELSSVQSELNRYRNQVNAYMMNHKMAAAAIALGVAGGNMALDDTNAFSEDAKALGGVAAAIAAIYAISNYEEVAEVFDVMMQADVQVKQYERNLREVNTRRGNLQRQLQQYQVSLGQVNHEIQSKQAALQAISY